MSNPSDLPMTKFWRFTLLPTSPLHSVEPISTNPTHQLFTKVLDFCRSATATQASTAHGHAIFQVIEIDSESCTADAAHNAKRSDTTSDQTFVLITGYPSVSLNETTDQEYFDSGMMAEMFGLASHGGLWLVKDCDVTKLGVNVSDDASSHGDGDAGGGLVRLVISEGTSQANPGGDAHGKALVLRGEEMEQGKAVKDVTIALSTANSVKALIAVETVAQFELGPIGGGHSLEMTLKRVM